MALCPSPAQNNSQEPGINWQNTTSLIVVQAWVVPLHKSSRFRMVSTSGCLLHKPKHMLSSSEASGPKKEVSNS